jgi:hypothetical protein
VVVVKLSRELRFDKVGLQAVHASPATPAVDVRAAGEPSAPALTFASGLRFGAIEPRPADVRFSTAELGVSTPGYGVQAVEDGEPVHQEGWPSLLERSGIDQVLAGRTYSLILVGPNPRIQKPGFWSDTAFVLIDNDPARD